MPAPAPLPIPQMANVDPAFLQILNQRFAALGAAIAAAGATQWAAAPLSSAGTAGTTTAPGAIAFDSAGNFYWAYSENRWARIGPGGYSNSF